MKKLLIDTNAYTAFKRNNHATVEVLRTATFIGINATVLAELLSGFKGGRRETQNLRELDEFLNTPRVHTIPLDSDTAEFYAHVFWELKGKGKPIPTNDIWVAASAIQHGLGLLSFDEHFSYLNGILLIRPQEES